MVSFDVHVGVVMQLRDIVLVWVIGELVPRLACVVEVCRGGHDA